MEIERERKGLLTLPFYLLVTLVDGSGEKKVSEINGPNDIIIKTVLMLRSTQVFI